MNLDDAAVPELDDCAKRIKRSTELRTSDKQSLLKYLGLPLNIFGAVSHVTRPSRLRVTAISPWTHLQNSFFQPYLPLQQIDLMQESTSYLVGTTNSIFQQQRDCQIDVLVNVRPGVTLPPPPSGRKCNNAHRVCFRLRLARSSLMILN